MLKVRKVYLQKSEAGLGGYGYPFLLQMVLLNAVHTDSQTGNASMVE